MATDDARAPLPPEGTVAVVGASLAGIRAVEALRQEGFGGRIVLVGAERHTPYDRPPLSKQVLSGAWAPERATLADAEKLAQLSVDARLGHRAESLDAEARRLELDDGTVLEADGIVLATGAAPRWLLGTAPSESVQALRTLDDALALHERVHKVGPGCRVVVIGAGFIGSEVASTCHELGCRVDVVEMLETPLEPVLGATIGAVCAGLHRDNGVRLHTGARVEEIVASGASHGATVGLAGGTTLHADVVVIGVGVAPGTGWLEGSGLSIGDGVRCDEALFAAPGVVAAGDLARWPHRGLGEEVRIEHWQVAAEAGAAAARNLLAGPEAKPFVPVPYFWSDQYGLRIQMLGRPAPDDEVAVVDGDLVSQRFVALYGRRGRFTGALGLSRPRQLMAYRPLLVEGATWDEALALTRT